MSFANDLKQLNQLLQGQAPWVPVQLVPCTLSVEPQRLTTPQAVWAVVQDFIKQHEATGWVETTQAVGLLSGGQVDTRFPILNAELAAGSRSLHIRHMDDVWCCTVYLEAAGDSHWAAEKEVVSAETGASSFVYRCYSTLSEQGQFKEQVARLVDVRRAA